MKKNDQKRKYVQLVIILVAVILTTIAASNIYNSYQDKKLENSYISKYIPKVQYNELDNALVELSTDAFLYISYTGDRKIHDFEVRLRRTLRDNELTDNMFYLNVNDMLENDDYIDDLNKKLDLNNTSITKLPSIIYYKNGEPVEVLNSTSSIIDTGKFVQLLEKYEVIEEK